MKTSTSPSVLALTPLKIALLLPLAIGLTILTGEETERSEDQPEETADAPERNEDAEETSSPETVSTEAAIEEADEANSSEEKEWERLGRGIRYRDLHVGDGETPGLWANVFVHYRIYSEYGLLLEDTFAAGRPERFIIGSGLMPTPLEMAVKTMKERGRRELMVPAEMFQPDDFRHHSEAHGGNLDQVRAALRPGMLLRTELSLMWVRPYDPAERHRFQ